MTCCMSTMQLLHSGEHVDHKRVEVEFLDIGEVWFEGVTDS